MCHLCSKRSCDANEYQINKSTGQQVIELNANLKSKKNDDISRHRTQSNDSPIQMVTYVFDNAYIQSMRWSVLNIDVFDLYLYDLYDMFSYDIHESLLVGE